ncbi:hypothetical protein ACFE04_005318 [Oxalis oulophora]
MFIATTWPISTQCYEDLSKTIKEVCKRAEKQAKASKEQVTSRDFDLGQAKEELAKLAFDKVALTQEVKELKASLAVTRSESETSKAEVASLAKEKTQLAEEKRKLYKDLSASLASMAGLAKARE